MAENSSEFIKNELISVKKLLKNSNECVLMISSVNEIIQIKIKYTQQKQLTAHFVFPAEYPQQRVCVQLKSSPLGERFLLSLTQQIEKDLSGGEMTGAPQIAFVLDLIRGVLQEHRLCVCAREISFVKQNLLRIAPPPSHPPHTSENENAAHGDVIKLRQKQSQILLTLRENGYFYSVKICVPDEYPEQQIKTEQIDSNFPAHLSLHFVSNANELSRLCCAASLSSTSSAVLAQLHKAFPAALHLEPPLSVRSVVEFLAVFCVREISSTLCSLCERRALPDQPQLAAQISQSAPEFPLRIYCGHVYHAGCLERYIFSNPFEKTSTSSSDGMSVSSTSGSTKKKEKNSGTKEVGSDKPCLQCGNTIYHENFRASQSEKEARWAAEQSKKREMEEILDFLS